MKNIRYSPRPQGHTPHTSMLLETHIDNASRLVVKAAVDETSEELRGRLTAADARLVEHAHLVLSMMLFRAKPLGIASGDPPAPDGAIRTRFAVYNTIACLRHILRSMRNVQVRLRHDRIISLICEKTGVDMVVDTDMVRIMCAMCDMGRYKLRQRRPLAHIDCWKMAGVMAKMGAAVSRRKRQGDIVCAPVASTVGPAAVKGLVQSQKFLVCAEMLMRQERL